MWRGPIGQKFVQAQEKGVRAMQVRGRKTTKAHYCSIQAVYSPCTCKYEYEGTARHPLVELPNGKFSVMDDAVKELRNRCSFLSAGNTFNEVVVNQYDLAENENDGCVGWHTDHNELLSGQTVILSISTHAPGIFCYAEDISG